MDLGLCRMIQWGRVGKQDQSYEWNQVNGAPASALDILLIFIDCVEVGVWGSICSWDLLDLQISLSSKHLRWKLQSSGCVSSSCRLITLPRFSLDVGTKSISDAPGICSAKHTLIIHKRQIIAKLLSSTWNWWHRRLPSPLRSNDQRFTQVSLSAGASVFFSKYHCDIISVCVKYIRSKSILIRQLKSSSAMQTTG